MIVSGNYFQVQIDFEPFWEKPPLFIWMQVISMKIFGVGAFAARFPNVVVGMCTLASLYLQGARLTAWELMQDKLPVTLITDNMAAHFMQKGEVDAIVVGTDRVAANGDVANKIGTYALAVLARAHRIPFYVACPISTIDMATRHGRDIPIEERGPEEVIGHAGRIWAPVDVRVANPAFDVTPARLVTALITERGVVLKPNAARMRALMQAGT